VRRVRVRVRGASGRLLSCRDPRPGRVARRRGLGSQHRRRQRRGRPRRAGRARRVAARLVPSRPRRGAGRRRRDRRRGAGRRNRFPSPVAGEKDTSMRGHTGDELLRLPVRAHGIRLGRAVDVFLHPSSPGGWGWTLCGENCTASCRFPASLAEGRRGGSPFVLPRPGPGFVLLARRLLAELRGRSVGADGSTLEDVVLGPGWAIEELVLERAGRRRRVPLDGIVLPVRSRARGG
jgi:hypothetical protein